MKAARVADIVDAVADSAHSRAIAGKEAHGISECLIRIGALERIVDTLVDALLEGTSADPHGKLKTAR